ncbi:NEDD8-activating enzyme E1 regulatory subunit, putative [Pediculus humanus corporis]|uniref:NEDD8-activating enzyme E1 regulatory subunit n=1 Tax=Pediculus humanus subsp. corporis TaxID=121224 RepID=E0W0X0_PEDHC|nr:NEDD8-activating enzyme E1 regulatory subunit, putative [Pediculus humanus corporis]EEB19276.1 NEDD8-activating enzyme E1 regulatory subunit, putative [Pediculus humanus corporis]
MASPAPKSPEQSDKNRKYDRQLRLWGDHGQSALENAKVCLINANCLGTEILKSLVLPGIGSFTIVDGKKVTDDDIESNFFLLADSCGKSRAEVTNQLLVELNPDVHGDYIDEDIEQVLENNPEFLNNFSIIVATELKEKTLMELSSKLWELDIPFLNCKSYGFLGYIRTQVKEHTVIESHPDNLPQDLRLDKPFPALIEYVNSVNLEEMELKDHAHVPYLVILFKYLEIWKKSTGKDFPRNFKEKESLKEMIRSGILKNDEGVPEVEENFEEAIRGINSAVIPTIVPSSIKQILDDDACINLTSKSKPFWVLAKALRDFIENEGNGCLPLRGSLPDMTANTFSYIALQQIYHTQAAKDADIVFRRVQQLLRELNQSPDTISEADTKLFCKHASELQLVRGTCITDEYQGKNTSLQSIVSELEPPGSMLLYYLLLRGVEKFYGEYNRYPGECNDDVQPDIVQLKGCIAKLLGEWGSGPLSKDDYVHEICRYGGCELHSISSFVGGCAAHEIIKLITKQYLPIQNTFIYDGMSSITATFSL